MKRESQVVCLRGKIVTRKADGWQTVGSSVGAI